MSKNPKQPADAAPEGATNAAGPAGADVVAAAQAAAQSAGQAQAATERVQQAVQDMAVDIAAMHKAAEAMLKQAEELMREAIESHNAVVATLESAVTGAAPGQAEAPAGDAATAALPTMTTAEAARLVRRRKVIEAPGAQPRVIEQSIGADEVLAFTDHGTHVVVVTVDGQKFSSADAG